MRGSSGTDRRSAGGAAWPLAARAQQPERMRRIGVLMGGAGRDPVEQARLAAFLDGLQQLGWTDGRNVRIDTRWPAGDADRRTYAAELVGLAPDVILASASASVAALQQASRRVRREPGATGRQRHRVHRVRIRHQREMAGAPKRDRAPRHPSGRHSRFGDIGGHRVWQRGCHARQFKSEPR